MSEKKDGSNDQYQHELPIGAWGYFLKFSKGLKSGQSIPEIMEEIKADADLDTAKRDLLSDAILYIIKNVSNKKP
jgi:hypothetical protein